MVKQQISKLSKNDIYEKEFKSSMRGYNQDEVDQFLDEIIKDYEAFENQIQKLETELANTKNRPQNLKKMCESSLFSQHSPRKGTRIMIFSEDCRISRSMFSAANSMINPLAGHDRNIYGWCK